MHAVRKILRNFLIILLVLLVVFVGATYWIVYQGTGKYPVYYTELIEREARSYGLEPTLVAAIIKTESDYRPDVVSEANARGLMQLTPETADWCAKQLKIDYDTQKLNDPEYNIHLGSFYLSYLIAKYQNQDLAIAAYNAGAVNVDSWLDSGKITREKESLDSIPFSETKEYVLRVNRAKKVYDTFYRDGFPTREQQEKRWSLALHNWLNFIVRTIKSY